MLIWQVERRLSGLLHRRQEQADEREAPAGAGHRRLVGSSAGHRSPVHEHLLKSDADAMGREGFLGTESLPHPEGLPMEQE